MAHFKQRPDHDTLQITQLCERFRRADRAWGGGAGFLTPQSAADTAALLAAGAVVESVGSGVYATAALLQAACPAASFVGKTASVGSAAPYTEYVSNGSAWLPVASFATDPLTGMVAMINPINGSAMPLGPYSAKNFVGTRIMTATGQGGFAQSGANYTWSLACAVPAAFTAIRLILQNNLLVPVTGVTACASVGGTASDLTNNAGTFTNATFAGASSVSLAAAPVAGNPSLTVSDWIPITSTPRVDGGTLPLVYVRCMTPLANTNAPLNGMGVGVTGWATKSDGLIWAWRFQSGDFVTTPSGMTGSTDPSSSPIVGIQYLSAAGAILSVATFGDSITSAYLATIPGDSWGHRAVASYAKGTSYANAGWAGQSTAQILVRAQVYIPLLKPSHAFYPLFSPNDGTPTAAIITAAYMRSLQFVDLCRQNGVYPIVWSGLPRTTDATNTASSYTNGQDDLRKGLNNAFAAIGVEFCDMAAAMSDTTALGTASKWVSAAATVEGLHPSNSGNDLMAAKALATLSKFAA